MTTGIQTTRRWIIVLITAALVAVTAAYGPVALEEVAGLPVTTPAYACQAAGGGGC